MKSYHSTVNLADNSTIDFLFLTSLPFCIFDFVRKVGYDNSIHSIKTIVRYLGHILYQRDIQSTENFNKKSSLFRKKSNNKPSRIEAQYTTRIHNSRVSNCLEFEVLPRSDVS